MKKVVLQLWVLMVVPFLAMAGGVTVEEKVQAFSKGEQPGFQMLIPQAKLKDVETAWTKYLKSGSKNKPETIGGEIYMPGAVNKNVSAEGFTVYSRLLETTEGVMLTAWFIKADSTFVSGNSTTGKNLAVEKYLTDFGNEQYKKAVEDELDAEKKKLNELEKELNNLVKDEEKSTKKINENQRSISRTKTDILTNESDQKMKMDQITAQKKVVESLKSSQGDAAKEAQKTQKSMESELKKLQKDNEQLHKQIDSWEKEIREEERNIDKSKQNQTLKQGEVEKQKQVIKGVEQKLSAI